MKKAHVGLAPQRITCYMHMHPHQRTGPALCLLCMKAAKLGSAETEGAPKGQARGDDVD